MRKCEVCGRETNRIARADGLNVCSKHMHQYYKYGKFLDNIPRTNSDLNEFRLLNENTVEFDVYYQNNTVSDSFIIDIEDLEKVRYHKWRKDTSGHIVTGNCTKTRPRKELTWLLLNIKEGSTIVVDHIDGDPMNNKKENLRICSQGENVCNKHFMSNNKSGVIGVHWDKKSNKWEPEITKNHKKCHLGKYVNFNEAVYVRYEAEKLIFKEFRAGNNDEYIKELISSIPNSTKNTLYKYTYNKLKEKGLL